MKYIFLYRNQMYTVQSWFYERTLTVYIGSTYISSIECVCVCLCAKRQRQLKLTCLLEIVVIVCFVRNVVQRLDHHFVDWINCNCNYKQVNLKMSHVPVETFEEEDAADLQFPKGKKQICICNLRNQSKLITKQNNSEQIDDELISSMWHLLYQQFANDNRKNVETLR